MVHAAAAGVHDPLLLEQAWWLWWGVIRVQMHATVALRPSYILDRGANLQYLYRRLRHSTAHGAQAGDGDDEVCP